ncbi:MAG: hypothetical protein WBW48_02465 [Anaerolineae bacterium]
MRNVLFVRKPVVQVALIILLLAVVAVVFTEVQDRAWATSATVTYDTLHASGAVAETRNTLRASGTVSETYHTLKVYGGSGWPELPGNVGAGSGIATDEITGLLAEDQPYTDTVAIFNPQLPQAPRKDSITWNPLFMSETQTGDENQHKGLYQKLIASGNNASEKVWFRMWYEPEHWDKDLNANGRLDRDAEGRPLAPVNPTPTGIDEWYPAIMQEFTYLLMDLDAVANKPEPTYGLAGATSLVFPVGMREEDISDPYGYGLTSLDGNFDGVPDIVRVESEQTLQSRTHIAADFDGDGVMDPLDPDGVPLNGDELAVFRLDTFNDVPVGGYVQFLDHLVEVEGVYNTGASLHVWYTGSSITASVGTKSVNVGGMLLAGTVGPMDSLSPGGGNVGVPKGPFFVYLENVDPEEATARLMVGRALGATHSAMEDGPGSPDDRPGDPWFLKRFYVDGHEYNVVAIKTRGNNYFQFITIRTPIPKVPVIIEQHSARLQDYPVEEPLSVMPPYNFEHYILKDVQAITAFDEDEDDVDYLGELVGPVPPILQKNGPFPYRGVYPDYPVGPYDDPREVYLRYVDEDTNPQFLGELKEKYGEISIEGGLVEAEDDPPVTRTGTWLSYTGAEPSGGEILYSNNWMMGDKVSFTFTGSSISLIHAPWNNRGIANITIDGTPYPDLDMYSPVLTWRVETLIASGLGAGSHTIEVKVSGNKNPSSGDYWVFVDAFRVGGEEFWYVEQWWTRPWHYTEFVLPDIHEDRTGVGNPDLYLLTSAFTAPQSEYLYWIQDEDFPDFPLRYNLAWDDVNYEWEHVLTDTISITPTLAGWKPRVKFWFDPAVGGKKYKDATGLRLYGRENEGAGDTTVVTDTVSTGLGTAQVEVPPYTDPWAPFNPQFEQAPRKDSLTFNPAYMDEYRNGSEPLRALYSQISIEEGLNAREKVFPRMWYEPEYVDKIRDTQVYTFPALMQEFTYMYLDTLDRPSHAQPGRAHFAFPMGTAADELPAPDPATGVLSFTSYTDPSRFGYGLTTFDADFDGFPEAVSIHSERTLSETTGIQADFDGDGNMDQLDTDGLELTGDELVIFAVEDINLGRYKSAMFLDFMVTVQNVSPGSPSTADLKFWFTGGGIYYIPGGFSIHPPDPIDTRTLEEGEMAVVYRIPPVHVIPAGGNNLGGGADGIPDGPWFVYLKGVNTWTETAVLTIGRALGATHSAIDDGTGNHDMTPSDPWYLKRFFVDGHEYNVVAIKTVLADSPGEDFEFKYITIRTPVPKVNFLNTEDSIKLEGYNQGTLFGLDSSIISVMPPFNSAHTRMVDIQRVEEGEFAHPDHYVTGCMGDWEGNVDPLQIQIVDEDTETQFFGELKEKLWPVPAPAHDIWSTEQFHTLPDQYTDLKLPAGQLYLLTSDWESDQSWVHYYGCDPTDDYFTQDELHDLHSGIPEPNAVITFTSSITNTYYTGPLRVKFWYDPEDPDGLYVGTWVITPTCTATASSNSPVCEGSTIELYGGPNGMDSYSWTGPNVFTSTTQSPTIPNATLAMSGTYTLTVIQGSCTVTATTQVTVKGKPTATASSNSPVLQGGILKLYGGPAGMASYSWTGPNSFNSNQISPTVSTSATLAMAGNYTLTVTNTNGCSDSDTTYVTVVTTGENQGYLAPQHSGVITYCNTTAVEIWVNATGFKSGQIKLTYNSTCAEVTNWVPITATFPLAEWDSTTSGQEWITFSALNPMTGTYRIGTLSIHCKSHDECTTALDFVEDGPMTTKVFDAWGSEIPGTWQDGTFGCGVGMCGDVAPYPGCNGEINMGDVSLLHSYVGHPGVYSLCCDWCGDVAPYPSCNGEINMGDVSLLHSYVGHPGQYHLCCEGILSATVPSAVSLAAAEVDLVPQESSAPFCETADVEIWVNATDLKAGQIKLTYVPTCADVTGWMSNTVEFPMGTWDSETPGEEWITFSAQEPMTGTKRIGTLTIHGVYAEGCATILDFVEEEPMPSKLFDDWGTEIPATWTPGTFRSVPKVYLPLVMKNSQ